jgi:hypothetical protein
MPAQLGQSQAYAANQISTKSGGSASWRSERTRPGGSWVWIAARLSAVVSSLHSYLILAYAGSAKAAEDVGFYYAANAGGRLMGILLSGLN